MKRWSKKVWLTVMLLVVAIMSVSASVVTAEASRVVYFTIQNNNACDSGYRKVMFDFNVNNISNNSGSVTVQLYDNSGTEITLPGNTTTTWYYPSNLTLGVPNTILGKKTLNYLVSFGGSSTANPCSRVPAYGKIVIDSDSGLFMANGGIRSNFVQDPYQEITDSQIIINEGKPF
jgi:hypothetical protein